jgi:CBS domain-containing protein
MKIGKLCHREIVTVPASASVREAASLMRDEHVGALAVTDPYAPGRVIGMVTDRDLVVDLLADGRDGAARPIGEFARTELAGVSDQADVHEAVQAMHRSGVRRLLLMGPDQAVTGLLSMDDLLGVVAGELAALAGTLRKGPERERARERGAAPAEAQAEPARALYISRNEP